VFAGTLEDNPESQRSEDCENEYKEILTEAGID
jgi:hypothetical protein